jgi:hypothetical protein
LGSGGVVQLRLKVRKKAFVVSRAAQEEVVFFPPLLKEVDVRPPALVAGWSSICPLRMIWD